MDIDDEPPRASLNYGSQTSNIGPRTTSIDFDTTTVNYPKISPENNNNEDDNYKFQSMDVDTPLNDEIEENIPKPVKKSKRRSSNNPFQKGKRRKSTGV